MGQYCCVNRIKDAVVQKQISSSTSSLIRQSLNTFKTSMSIVLLYLTQRHQVNLKSILELSSKCDLHYHISCYFEPDYLQKKFGLVEFQSPGSCINNQSLSQAFWNDIDYFYEKGIFKEILKFKVLLLVEIENQGKYAMGICSNQMNCKENRFSLYGSFNRTKKFKENSFLNEQNFNSYLNRLGELFILQKTSKRVFIKLLTFQQMNDKCIRPIDNFLSLFTFEPLLISQIIQDAAFKQVNVNQKEEAKLETQEQVLTQNSPTYTLSQQIHFKMIPNLKKTSPIPNQENVALPISFDLSINFESKMPTRGLVLNFPIDYQFIDPIMKESTNHDEFFSEDDSVMNEMIN